MPSHAYKIRAGRPPYAPSMASGTLTDEQLRSLDAAEAVLNNSYNPYSHFAVGACRQMLYEFAELGGNDPWVVLSTPAREKVEITSVRALLPYGFGPNNLKS